MTQLFKHRNELWVWGGVTEGNGFATSLTSDARKGSRKEEQEEGRKGKDKQFYVSCYVILSQHIKKLPDTHYGISHDFI